MSTRVLWAESNWLGQEHRLAVYKNRPEFLEACSQTVLFPLGVLVSDGSRGISGGPHWSDCFLPYLLFVFEPRVFVVCFAGLFLLQREGGLFWLCGRPVLLPFSMFHFSSGFVFDLQVFLLLFSPVAQHRPTRDTKQDGLSFGDGTILVLKITP